MTKEFWELESWLNRMGTKAMVDTAFGDGKIEGKIETAKNFKNLGVSYDIIQQATGLTKEEIEAL